MKQVNEKILIFGGSFDPVHQVHLDLVKQAIRQFGINHTFIVPLGRSCDLNKHLIAQTNARLKMLHLALNEAKLTNVQISTFECRRQQISYTIDTLNYFQKKFPQAHLFLMIGADQVINFPNWKKATEIANTAQIIYARRPDYALDGYQKIIDDYHMVELNIAPQTGASSSFRLSGDFTGLATSVRNFINENGVYGELRLKHLSPQRFSHSLRVAKIAKSIALGNHLKELVKKAYVAGLFHDYAKELPPQTMLTIAKENQIKGYAHLKTLHGPVAAILLQQTLGFTDQAVLKAIYYHTEPFLNDHRPSQLDKIVYVADKIEIARKRFFQNPSYYYKIRRLCLTNINAGFSQLYEISLKYFVKREMVTLK